MEDINMSFNERDIKYFRSRVWKLLFLFEDDDLTLPSCINSLIHKFKGLLEYVEDSKKPFMKDAICILRELYNNSVNKDYDYELVRKVIFECSGLIEKSFKVGG